MPILSRTLLLIKRNAFLYTLYACFFWLRVFDIFSGSAIASTFIWSILWLTPFIYVEPSIRRTIIPEFWVHRSYILALELFTLLLLCLYLLFVKFVVYGSMLTASDVILLLVVSILYHFVETVRKLEECTCFLTLNLLALLFAFLLHGILAPLVS